MKKPKTIRFVQLEAEIELHDNHESPIGDIQFPLDVVLLNALFDIQVNAEDIGEKSVWLYYRGESLNIHGKTPPTTIGLQEILRLRDRVSRAAGVEEAKEALRDALGIANGV